MPSRALIIALLVLGAAPPAPTGQADATSALVREAEVLYRGGAYAQALKKYQEAFAAGHESPSALYQAANCYKAALSDETREIELKKKAVPLFEREIASGQAGIASYYYLAAIYVHSLHDPVKGVEVARKGVALLEKPGADLESPLENVYRAARLHEFLGQDDEASVLDERFQKAAAVSPVPVERAALRISREKLAAHLVKSGKNEAAAGVYEALVKDEPLRDAERHQWGLALLRSGKPEEAAKAWRGAATDEYRTEMAYLDKVASRYAQSGKPDASSTVPNATALDDATLARKIIEAGAALRTLKQTAEKELKEGAAKAAEEETRRTEAFLKLSPEERKARWLAERDRIEAEQKKKKKDTQPAPPVSSAAARPVKSDEWLAAEREFFYLLTEYVKRGHLIRMYCFQNGLADLVFR